MNNDLRILENGDYLVISTGEIIPKREIGRMYEKDHKEKKPEGGEFRLEEGQCSGPVQLNG